MINELDQVVLRRDMPDNGLTGVGYEVEFATLAADTIAVVSVYAADVRAADLREIAHARAMA